MTVSYTSPSSSDSDAVRWMLGDTDTSDAYLQDEEIDWAIDQEDTLALAAAVCAEAIAGKLARLTDLSLDDTSVSYSQRHRHYMDLAERLRDQGVPALEAVGAGPDSSLELHGDSRDPFFTFAEFDSQTPTQLSDG